MRLVRVLLCATCFLVPAAGSAQTTSSPPPDAASGSSQSTSAAPSGPPWATAALATPPTRAELREAHERFQRAVELTDNQNFSDALTEFMRAYQLTHNPRVLYNISVTYESLGDFIDGLDALHAFVSLAPREIIARQRDAIALAETRFTNQIGMIQVVVEVPELDVRIDGIQRSSADARAGIRANAGRHHLTLASPLHQSRDADLEVRGGTTVRFAEPLRRLESSITVEANVPAAEIVVDGHLVGTTPFARSIPVAQGVHHLEVRRVGYNTYTTEVNVGSQLAHVVAQLGWADSVATNIAGHLAIHVTEPGAHATLDGRAIRLENADGLPPGPHRLHVERADRIAIEREVILPSGREVNVDVSMVPTVSWRLDRERSLRTIGWLTAGVGAVLVLGGGVWFLANEIAAQQTKGNIDQLTFQYAGITPPTSVQSQLAELRSNMTIHGALRYASGAIGGVGVLAAATGLGIVLAAPRLSGGQQRPSFQIRLGLTSVSVAGTF